MDLAAKDEHLLRNIGAGGHLARTFEGLMALGPRLLGSPGERRGQEYLAGLLEGYGLPVTFQSFDVHTYRRGRCWAEARGSGRALPLAVQAFAFAPATGGPQVLDLVRAGAGDPEDVERLGDALAGRAVYCRPVDEMRSRRHERVTEAGALAGLYASHLTHHDGCIISMVRPTRRPPAPGLGLNRSSTDALEDLLRRGPARLALEVEGETLPSTSGNLEARLDGAASLPDIVLGGHLDTYDVAEGAMDNGAGAVLIVELARVFAGLPAPRRGVRFVLFTGEERSCTGSRRYVEERLDRPRPAGLFYNVDMPAEGGVPGVLTTGCHVEEGYWEALAGELGVPFPVAEAPPRYSDHGPFAERGLPCLWTRAARTGTRGLAALEHTSLDTADKVDLAELREAALLTGRILLRLADAEETPCRDCAA